MKRALLLLLLFASQTGLGQQDPFVLPVKHYRVVNAEIRDVLRDFFDSIGMPATVSPRLQGKVTIDLRDATMGAIFNAVLKQVNGTYRAEGGIIEIVAIEPPGGCCFDDPVEQEKRPDKLAVGDGQHVYTLVANRVEKFDRLSMKSLGSVTLERRFKAATVDLGTVAGRETLRRQIRLADRDLHLLEGLTGIVKIPEGPATAEAAATWLYKALKPPPGYESSRNLLCLLFEFDYLKEQRVNPVLSYDSDNLLISLGRWKYTIRKADLKILSYSELDAD